MRLRQILFAADNRNIITRICIMIICLISNITSTGFSLCLGIVFINNMTGSAFLARTDNTYSDKRNCNNQRFHLTEFITSKV